MPPTTIEPDRLMRAVDAVLAVSRARMDSGGAVDYPPDLYRRRPVAFDGFTLDEVQEASDFLFRMGFLIWGS